MPIIIMPPHAIIIGIPDCIIVIMRLQASMNIALSMPAIGFISHIMPLAVMVQVISHIIMGIMPIIICMGICIGIMPFMPIWGIMPPIIGICIGICIIWGIICMAGFIWVAPGWGTALVRCRAL